MDTTEKPTRRYRKKWWIAAGALWLLLSPVFYPLSLGPWYYCSRRGWLGHGDFRAQVYYRLYGQLSWRQHDGPAWYLRYNEWWIDLADAHREAQARQVSDVPPTADPTSN